MPENLFGKKANASAGINSWLGSNNVNQRRDDILQRVQLSAEQCRLNYEGRKELATEEDDTVTELCETLEEALSYGLRQQQNSVMLTAANLFQNMQEIVTGSSSAASANETTFWDFCQTQLTPHERQRYENLKHVRTKCGRGKSFIRATLNEHSLQRYLLTWLNGTPTEENGGLLARYYTHWSLLLHVDSADQLANIVGSLNGVLFALTVDTTELNVATRSNHIVAPPKVEPIIYAPVPTAPSSNKGKRAGSNAVERPISSSTSTDDLMTALDDAKLLDASKAAEVVGVTEELAATPVVSEPPDPIEPELEFLKQPLPEFYPENHRNGIPESTENNGCASSGSLDTFAERDFEEDKSDSSSQYSKTSSALGNSQQNVELEEKLREMQERCALLETRVAQLSRDNRLLVRRLTHHFNESGINPSSSLAANFLIGIPHVELIKAGRGSSSYHAYEIHITMRQHLEHWSVLRRYRDFYKLHKMLLRTHPSIAATVEFPPKKHFGNMNAVFVEERRQQLQIYLLNLVEALPQVEACKSKTELQKAFPFFRER